jgi:hypothetical protein
MNGELVKRQDRWDLYAEDGSKIGSSAPNPMNKLSIKNCEAVANGYDLDELAREACDITDTLRLDSQKYKQDPYFKIGFIKGFQKALELLGDKKYNYGHLDKMFTCGKLYQDSKNEAYCFDNVLSKFEQTEWDVEIVMDICGDKVYAVPELVLDAEGCLILKRK